MAWQRREYSIGSSAKTSENLQRFRFQNDLTRRLDNDTCDKYLNNFSFLSTIFKKVSRFMFLFLNRGPFRDWEMRNNISDLILNHKECAATLIFKSFQQVLIKQENGNITTWIHLMCVMFSGNARGSYGNVKLKIQDSFVCFYVAFLIL